MAIAPSGLDPLLAIAGRAWGWAIPAAGTQGAVRAIRRGGWQLLPSPQCPSREGYPAAHSTEEPRVRGGVWRIGDCRVAPLGLIMGLGPRGWCHDPERAGLAVLTMGRTAKGAISLGWRLAPHSWMRLGLG
jgi:hypothetical protein